MPVTSTENRIDVLVVGGGPAGCATALQLVRNGCRVTVLHRHAIQKCRVGESLLPAAEGLLRMLDLWGRFQQERFQLCTGIVSVWGKTRPDASSFLCHPFSLGWNVDRVRFDNMLLEACRDAGCRILHTDGPLNVRRAGVVWHVETKEFSKTIDVDFIVDATGRTASVATSLGAKRTSSDRLMAMVGYFPHEPDSDSRLWIESAPGGWWYSAGLPNNRMVAVFLTDLDFIPRNQQSRRLMWFSKLSETEYTSNRIGANRLSSPLRLVDARTGQLDRACGPGWIAVGDAAITLDPLSGNGVIRALRMGIAAGDVILGRNNESFTAAYQELIRGIAGDGAMQSLSAYRRETRWDSSFWRRRRADNADVSHLSPVATPVTSMALDEKDRK